MGGKARSRKKAVSLHLPPDVQAEIDDKWAFELSMREVLIDLNDYFAALRIACMQQSRRRYKAASKWAGIAHERLVEALEVDRNIRDYLEPFDVDDIEEVETLPRARKRRSKAEVVAAVLARNAKSYP